MSEATVIFIDEHSAQMAHLVAMADELRGKLANNEVSGMVVVGIDTSGETFFQMIEPLNAPTLRRLLLGMLAEASHTLAAAAEIEHD